MCEGAPKLSGFRALSGSLSGSSCYFINDGWMPGQFLNTIRDCPVCKWLQPSQGPGIPARISTLSASTSILFPFLISSSLKWVSTAFLKCRALYSTCRCCLLYCYRLHELTKEVSRRWQFNSARLITEAGPSVFLVKHAPLMHQYNAAGEVQTRCVVHLGRLVLGRRRCIVALQVLQPPPLPKRNTNRNISSQQLPICRHQPPRLCQ
jgi:hypothetical protein